MSKDTYTFPPAEQVSKEELVDFIANVKSRQQSKMESKTLNRNPQVYRLDDVALRKLDSNLKKNAAFVKKIKSFTENQKESLLKDFQVTILI